MKIPEKDIVLVLWQCMHCDMTNKRFIRKDSFLVDDTCEFCGTHVHEPITTRISMEDLEEDV